MSKKVKQLIAIGSVALVCVVAIILIWTLIMTGTERHKHTMTYVEAVEATCAQGGTVGYWQCTECERCFADEQGTDLLLSLDVPALGHDFGEFEVVTQVTCTQDGERVSTCSRCGEAQREVLPSLGHQPGAPVRENETAVACNEVGSYDSVVYCERCGAELSRERIEGEVLGHAWDGGRITLQPTCTQAGESLYTCTRCGETKTESVAAVGHTEVIDAAADPTCTETGLTEGSHCAVCGATLIAQKTVESLGHDYVGAVTKQPTCTQAGERTYTCTRCDDSYTGPVAALGHTYAGGICTECGDKEIVATAGLVFTLSDDGTYYIVTDYTGSDVEVYIPATHQGLPVTSIGDEAFRYCDSLTRVTIPSSVTSIGDHAFSSCDSLTNITVAAGNTVYHSAGNCIIETASKTLIAGCKTSVIPSDGSVTSIKDYAFYGCDSLTSVIIGDGVTSIGDGAFAHCDSLASVTIPDSVTSIGEGAFSWCGSLTRVSITDIAAWCNIDFGSAYSNPLAYAHNLYLNGQLVTDLVIPDGVTSIGDDAFWNCTSLTSVTIPSSVTSIGDRAFDNCTSLTSVTIPSSVTSIGEYAFAWCESLTSVIIGDGVTSIGDNAFQCYNLTSVYITDIAAWCNIDFGSASSNPLGYAHNLYLNGQLVTDLVIPDGVTSIGDDAFWNCTSLTSVTIPSSVTSIGDHAFSDCDSLTSVTIPDSVTSIGESAFSFCSGLTSITIGDSVTSIGYDAFYDCEILTSVYITDIAAWCDIDFYNSNSNPLYYAHNLYLNGQLVTDLVIPDNVTSIKDYAFRNYDSLTSVAIGDGVTSIGSYAFYGCDSLTSVTIGDGVTSIGDRAFWNCDSLTSVYITDIAAWCNIDFDSYYGYYSNPLKYAGNLYLNGQLVTDLVIPESVTSIGDGAFQNCTSLTSVTIGDGVTSIGDGAFSWCESLTSVYITDIAAWCNIDFDGSSSNPLYYAHNLYLNGQLVTDLVIPDSITSIKDYAFRNYDSLTSVAIGDGVTSIGSYAFYGCDSLTSVVFENTSGWKAGTMTISSYQLSNSGTAALYLRDAYRGYTWTRS